MQNPLKPRRTQKKHRRKRINKVGAASGQRTWKTRIIFEMWQSPRVQKYLADGGSMGYVGERKR